MPLPDLRRSAMARSKSLQQRIPRLAYQANPSREIFGINEFSTEAWQTNKTNSRFTLVTIHISTCTAVSGGAGGALHGHQRVGLELLLRLEPKNPQLV